jgi:nucleotide-binding universal stress UspA family protein
MPKNILLPVDNSKNSLKAVKHVADSIRPDARITLFSIIPDPIDACGLEGPGLNPIFKENVQVFCAISDVKKAAMEGFMEEAKKVLEKAGFPSKNIIMKAVDKKAGIARDILKEAAKGEYDMIVLGRRGLTSVKGFVMGSISQKIVQNAKNITLTLVE